MIYAPKPAGHGATRPRTHHTPKGHLPAPGARNSPAVSPDQDTKDQHKAKSRAGTGIILWSLPTTSPGSDAPHLVVRMR